MASCDISREDDVARCGHRRCPPTHRQRQNYTRLRRMCHERLLAHRLLSLDKQLLLVNI